MAKLEIVWRNPSKVKNRLRCSPQTKLGDRKLYMVQQLLSGVHDVWVNTSVLEVVSRRLPVRTQQDSAPPWRLGFGS